MQWKTKEKESYLLRNLIYSHLIIVYNGILFVYPKWRRVFNSVLRQTFTRLWSSTDERTSIVIPNEIHLLPSKVLIIYQKFCPSPKCFSYKRSVLKKNNKKTKYTSVNSITQGTKFFVRINKCLNCRNIIIIFFFG